ncbi:PIG-L deacetylase family protein [Psychrobium sp. nBUS_13]|uniref:PIG-L deacetylase family protein n=1 Tax=Psychrobium sp. nBUS_13 TaxID=3395319 RepID=UPI003EB9E839
MKNILVVAPHADDETLGCGATLLKHISKGDRVHWLLCSSMNESYSQEKRAQRSSEIQQVIKRYPMTSSKQLKLPPATLDLLSQSTIISEMYGYVQSTKPSIVYIPYRNDAHNDHQQVFDAILACCKSFRSPFVSKILMYETLSETDFALKPEDPGFKPNCYEDITEFLDEKLNILTIYESELAPFPFPRSVEAIRALAQVRGVQSGCMAAEAFMIIKEINR